MAPAAVAKSSRASMELLEARRPSFPAGLRVLLVEQQAELPATLRLLREHRYEPVCAEDAAHAAALLEGGDLDVLLVDIATAGAQLQQLAAAAAAAGAPLVVAGGRCGPDQLQVLESAAAYLERPLSQLCIKTLWQHTVRSLMRGPSPQPGVAASVAAAAEPRAPADAEPSSSSGGGSSQQRPARRKAKRSSSSSSNSSGSGAAGSEARPPPAAQQQQLEQPKQQQPKQQPASPRTAYGSTDAAATADADCLAGLALPPLGRTSIAFDPDTILLDLHLDAAQPDQPSLDDLLCCPGEEDSATVEHDLLLGGCSSGAASGDTLLQELESADFTSAPGKPGAYLSMASVQSPFSQRTAGGAGPSAAAAMPGLGLPAAAAAAVPPPAALPVAWAAPPPGARGMVWGMPLHTVATVPGVVVQPAAAAAAAGSTSASSQVAASVVTATAAAPVPVAPVSWWSCVPAMMLPQPFPVSSSQYMMQPGYCAWPGMAAMYPGGYAAGGMASWPAGGYMHVPVIQSAAAAVQPAAAVAQPAAAAATEQQAAAKDSSVAGSGEAGGSAMLCAGSLASSADVFVPAQLCSSSSAASPTCSSGLPSDAALACRGLVC